MIANWLMRDRVPERRSFVNAPLSLPLQLAWKTAVVGPAVSQATAAGGIVYVNTYSRLNALDIRTGANVWDFRPRQSRDYDEKLSVNIAFLKNGRTGNH